MNQVFLLGSSSVYGVGAETAGWADRIKQYLHKRMYQTAGEGETWEVYNFGKSGATIDFVIETFPKQIEKYGRDGKKIAIVSVGGNNAKAENTPDNFVSTLEDYQIQMAQLMKVVSELTDQVIAVGGGYYDESKTNPKHNPLTGGKSFFSNERKQKFQQAWLEICAEMKIPFVSIDLTEDQWLAEYIFEDGLHPNQKGHEYIADKVIDQLNKYL